MKIKGLIFTMALAGFMAACSNEDDLVLDNGNNNVTEVTGEAYASFAFQLPSAGVPTRANPTGGAGGDGEEAGTVSEQTINTVSILLFKDGKLAQNISLARNQFNPSNSGVAVTYTTKESIKVSEGEQKVYVVVNPTATIKALAATASQADFEKLTLSETDGYADANYFLMTNADAVQTINPDKDLNTVTNPVAITVRVERIAAKITYKAKKEANTYSVVDENNVEVATVAFTDYRVINTRNAAYYLRRAGVDAASAVLGEKETGSNYVIDNIFASKTSTFNAELFEANYLNKFNLAGTFSTLSKDVANEAPLTYCLENTMAQSAQINGYTTGVIFKAVYTPAAGAITGTLTDSKDFYRFNGILYASLKDLTKALNPKWEANGFKDEDLTNDLLGIKNRAEGTTVEDYLEGINNVNTLYALSVDYYQRGVCYYRFWIRHANNGNNAEMGVMEFGIVRNNVYKLSINTVSKLGNIGDGPDGPDPVDPDQPDEDPDAYLQVSVEVLPWTVRLNEIDF